ncbi:receptor-interacting serine/threonine-protein kinase 2 isoform X2 [Gallus gallus]|nr:receptor-interacting serine/threonine-protein kinase 2 isoform X2 [Gallus gallus]XP_046781786.1 receptor-interacting serine/threonine-protein kinase 2 isoform X2 [Gallus gallus]|eukprot:XP_025010037.1 receptor-interacting serine/threonine-protein kinase 2 isoform X2 [Gallus gallus]
MINGSLHSLIHKHQLYPDLPFPLLIRILSDVAEGLHYLHSLLPADCHCRLKPSNVLLDAQYRARITDYGLTNWRHQKQRSDLQNCQRKCQDLVYIAPEILEGSPSSQEGDIDSFGILCWESIGRQKTFEGQTNRLGALTGICNSLQPANSEKFVPSNLPKGNRLLHFITLCCHQEPDYRPHAAESVELLNGILTSISKKEISTAVYNLMHAKETAINVCKGSEVYTLQTGIQNSEVICQQKLSQVMSKKIPPVVQSLSPILLGSSTNTARRENILQADLTNPITQDSTKKGRENCQRKDPPLTLKHSPQTMHPEQPVTGPCCKGNCSQILASQRGTILSCMTEGRLNHILDILRSQQMLSRIDYETIISYPTVTSRARALLDICLCLGEKAAQVVVTVLTVNKCSPLARGSHCIGWPETNRLLL